MIISSAEEGKLIFSVVYKSNKERPAELCACLDVAQN